MITFQLFRIRVQLPRQLELFEGRRPGELLRTAVEQKPSAQLRRGHTWHIGNISSPDRSGLFFALGRITSSIVEKYDEERGDFIEEQQETAPYTHVVVDTELQVCAIAGKSKLAPTIAGIARQLGRLLNASVLAEETKLRFDVREITDPSDFIAHLKSAYAIRKFWMTFALPNPFDVNEDFQRPMERLLKEADGDRGKTGISGEGLNPELLETLTRSAVASGQEAAADLQVAEDQPPVRRHTRGNPVTTGEESIDSDEQKAGLLNKMRRIYCRIRTQQETNSRP